MEILDWRKKIDELDAQIVSLLNERAACAVEIGKLKKILNLPISDFSREEEVLEKVSRESFPLSPSAMKRIYSLLISETKKIEE